MNGELAIQVSGDTLVATVDRPEGNLFTGEMIDSLVDEVERAGRTPHTRFVHLRARGATFCTGREREGATPDELRHEAARIVRVNETLRTSPLTVVAEVQGPAAGFGAGLVAASDVAVASTSATLSFPEILAGLAPTIVVGWANFTLPHKRAYEMVATGREMSAAEAAAAGLVTETVAPEALEGRVHQFIEELRAKHAGNLRAIKRFFAQTRNMLPAAAADASIDSLVLASLRMRAEG